jgi:PKD repeat protein
LDAGFTGMGYTYLWNTAATSQSITVSSEQVYRVTVTTGSGCYGIDSVYVRILPLPTAAFSYTISSTSLAFINNSANSTSYYWLFGDNTTATLSNPYHYYFNPGCYDVSLIARNSCFTDTITQRIAVGVSSTLCQPITIVVPPPVPEEEEAWKLYPNPNSGSYQIEFNTSEENEPVIVQIIDIRGQIIWEEQYQFGKGLQQIFISDLQLPNGMYINRLIRKNGIQSKSFVLMRS